MIVICGAGKPLINIVRREVPTCIAYARVHSRCNRVSVRFPAKSNYIIKRKTAALELPTAIEGCTRERIIFALLSLSALITNDLQTN